jgi:Ca2+/H+ antiporter
LVAVDLAAPRAAESRAAAAEHWVAVLAARKDQMNLAVNISIGSSAQIAFSFVIA